MDHAKIKGPQIFYLEVHEICMKLEVEVAKSGARVCHVRIS